MADTNRILPPRDEDVDDLDELGEVIPETFSITSYGADYPVDGLVKRLEEGDIIIPLFSMTPEEGQTTIGFQRESSGRSHRQTALLNLSCSAFQSLAFSWSRNRMGNSSSSMDNSAFKH